MAQLNLLLLGPPLIECNGVPIKVDTRKATALLAYLAVTRQMHSRETLAALFWPDTADSRARLRRTLSVLHTALARSWLDIERETISLERNASLWADVDHFHALLAGCRTHGHPADVVCLACLMALGEAAALYRDDFMTGFSLRDSPGFDEWQTVQTEQLRRELISVLQRLGRGHSARGEFEPAMNAARRWLVLDPLDEAGHRLLMHIAARAGQRSVALRQYQECQRLLDAELGVAPAAETTTLYEQIREGLLDTMSGWSERPPDEPSSITLIPAHPLTPSSLLPAFAAPFIGRTHELAEIGAILAKPDCRLLTLVGVGGMGKTRLAVQVAITQKEQFAHGVCFVALEAVENDQLLPTAVSKALGLALRGDHPNQQLLSVLRERNLLLILDNMEHLPDGVAWVSQALREAPRLKLLVTSRQPLQVQGEWLFPVAGMSFPAVETTDDVTPYSAVQLFWQRAALAQPGFAPTLAEQQAINRICRLLAGMPLGIELAAAWISLLSCAEIAQEIEQSLDFLTSPWQDVPERHRSLRAVFESTWLRLTEPEREAMQRLSVFQGGFDRNAALTVTGATLPTLLRLSGKSLLPRRTDGRYTLHPLLRQYAAERLHRDEGMAMAVAQRHCDYYAHWLHQHRGDTMRLDVLNEMAANLENIRLAWSWAINQAQTAFLDQMVIPLYDLYESRSWYQEAALIFDEAIQGLAHNSQPQTTALLAKLRARQGAIYYRLGRLDESLHLLHDSLTLSQAQDNQPEVAFVWRIWGIVLHIRGEYAEAIAYHQQALALYTQLADQEGIAGTLHNWGLTLNSMGQMQQARTHYLRSQAIKREIGDQVGLALTINNLGALALASGDYQEARRCLLEGLQLAEQSGNLYVAGFALNNLGLMARSEGQQAQEVAYFTAAMTHFQKIGYRVGEAGTLLNLGWRAAQQGAYAQAQQHFAVSRAIFESVGDASGAALCLFNWGLIAERQNDYEAAKEHYRQSLAIQQGTGEMGEVVYTLFGLGRVAIAEGAYTAARRYLHEALQMGQALEAVPALLEALIVAAYLWLRLGQREKAAGLLRTVWQHPACTPEVSADAELLLADYGVQIPRQDTAVTDSKVADRWLARAVQNLLQELAKADEE